MPPGPKEINERLGRIEAAARLISLRLAATRGDSLGEDVKAVLDGKASVSEEGELIYKPQAGLVELQIEAPSPAETRARQQEENQAERPAPLRPPPGKHS